MIWSHAARPRPGSLFTAALLHPPQVALFGIRRNFGASDVACLVLAVSEAVAAGVPTRAHDRPFYLCSVVEVHPRELSP